MLALSLMSRMADLSVTCTANGKDSNGHHKFELEPVIAAFATQRVGSGTWNCITSSVSFLAWYSLRNAGVADPVIMYLPAARLKRNTRVQVDSTTRLGSNQHETKTIEALQMQTLVHHRHGHKSGSGPSQTPRSTFYL